MAGQLSHLTPSPSGGVGLLGAAGASVLPATSPSGAWQAGHAVHGPSGRGSGAAADAGSARHLYRDPSSHFMNHLGEDRFLRSPVDSPAHRGSPAAPRDGAPAPPSSTAPDAPPPLPVSSLPLDAPDVVAANASVRPHAERVPVVGGQPPGADADADADEAWDTLPAGRPTPTMVVRMTPAHMRRPAQSTAASGGAGANVGQATPHPSHGADNDDDDDDSPVRLFYTGPTAWCDVTSGTANVVHKIMGDTPNQYVTDFDLSRWIEPHESERLMQDWFDLDNLVLMQVHEATFWRQWRRRPLLRVTAATAVMIVTQMTRGRPESLAVGRDPATGKQVQRTFRELAMILDGVLHNFVSELAFGPSDVATVQFLMVAHTMIFRNLGLRYRLSGLATRMAYELGLHRNLEQFQQTVRLSPMQINERRTGWFTVYLLDTISALFTGRPGLIRSEDWETSLPTDLAPDVRVYMEQMLKLLAIASDQYRFIVQVRVKYTANERHSHWLHFHRRYVAWLDHLPAWLHCTHVQDAQPSPPSPGDRMSVTTRRLAAWMLEIQFVTNAWALEHLFGPTDPPYRLAHASLSERMSTALSMKFTPPYSHNRPIALGLATSTTTNMEQVGYLLLVLMNIEGAVAGVPKAWGYVDHVLDLISNRMQRNADLYCIFFASIVLRLTSGRLKHPRAKVLQERLLVVTARYKASMRTVPVHTVGSPKGKRPKRAAAESGDGSGDDRPPRHLSPPPDAARHAQSTSPAQQAETTASTSPAIPSPCALVSVTDVDGPAASSASSSSASSSSSSSSSATGPSRPKDGVNAAFAAPYSPHVPPLYPLEGKMSTPTSSSVASAPASASTSTPAVSAATESMAPSQNALTLAGGLLPQPLMNASNGGGTGTGTAAGAMGSQTALPGLLGAGDPSTDASDIASYMMQPSDLSLLTALDFDLPGLMLPFDHLFGIYGFPLG
ncbi:hypothetical protein CAUPRSCDRAFT_11778, partial [Caulochytrium protostelioides]